MLKRTLEPLVVFCFESLKVHWLSIHSLMIFAVVQGKAWREPREQSGVNSSRQKSNNFSPPSIPPDLVYNLHNLRAAT